ncbi:response regulator [Thermophagus sp. OGC60D27]|uniref:response regulator n=1 Tax=Thermophagus sp. OGC60D27 TaxID=3458415 RepID=UPI004037B1CE
MAKILISEDDKLIAGIIGKILARDDHQIKIVPDGAMAIKELREEQYDLIITDMIMPGYSGLDVLRYVRRQLRSHSPVLIMSGMSEKEYVRKAKKMGATDFITKPIKEEKLRRKVSQLLSIQESSDNKSDHQSSSEQPAF